LSAGAKAGIVLGVAIGISLLIAIVVLLICGMNKKRSTPSQAAVNDGFDGKVEMSAGDVDSKLTGAVQPKPELSNANIERKPISTEKFYEVQSEPRHEIDNTTAANAPWTHITYGYTPAELQSTGILEANSHMAQQAAGAGYASKRCQISAQAITHKQRCNNLSLATPQMQRLPIPSFRKSV
jgi:hypothetical protein